MKQIQDPTFKTRWTVADRQGSILFSDNTFETRLRLEFIKTESFLSIIGKLKGTGALCLAKIPTADLMDLLSRLLKEYQFSKIDAEIFNLEVIENAEKELLALQALEAQLSKTLKICRSRIKSLEAKL